MGGVSGTEALRRSRLLRQGFALEWITLGWNVVGIFVLAAAAISARSVALAGFGLDSVIEIGASLVVIWELTGTGEARQRKALRMIGLAFLALAVYLSIQSLVVLISGFHPRHSPAGIVWSGLTAVVMFSRCGKGARRPSARQPRAPHRRPRHLDRRSPRHSRPCRIGPERRARMVVGRSAGWVRPGLLRRARGQGCCPVVEAPT